MKPGEIIVKRTEIEVNQGHNATILNVKNTGDRPIQVGSHYHFFEANPALQDIPAGAAVRFEPGDEKEVQLVEYSGKRKIYGFHGDVNGSIDESRVYKPEDDGTATEVIAEQDKTSKNANKGRG